MTDSEQTRELREALAKAREVLQKQNDSLQRLAESSHRVGTVVRLLGNKMIVNDGSAALLSVNRVDEATVGSSVHMVQPTMQVIGVYESDVPSGVVATVREVPAPGLVEIDSSWGGGSRVLHDGGQALSAGDRVVIDSASFSVIGKLGKARSRHLFSEPCDVGWDDVGGQEEAKTALREAIELPYQSPEVFRRYGKRPANGVLLFGPPGCGKTMLGKAVATSLARTHGQSAAEGFLYVKGPALLSKWLGETEHNIRELFVTAREHRRRNGYPGVIFIDEADALLGARGEDHSSRHQSTIVPQFLSEMDGLEDSGAFVLLATNRPSALDPAVIRDGRVDKKIKVRRPNEHEFSGILLRCLRDKPCEYDTTELAFAATFETFQDSRIVRQLLYDGQVLRLRMRDLVSGAMAASLVEQATSRAMRRDVESATCGGLTSEDVRWAVDQTERGLASLDHTEALREIYDNGQTESTVSRQGGN